jgi:hypothetical protein
MYITTSIFLGDWEGGDVGRCGGGGGIVTGKGEMRGLIHGTIYSSPSETKSHLSSQ